MIIILVLFFISFFGIIFMIGRKLSLVRNGQVVIREKALLEIPHIEKIKDLAIKNLKKYEHISLVMAIRFYVRSTNFLKDKYKKIKVKIKNINTKKDSNGNGIEKVEVSKFLKMISDYKRKIREIKHKIHEEEENL